MTDAPQLSSLAEVMTLEPHGPDVFVGLSPEYPWGRVYGGQVVAQGLRAAALTVDPDCSPHSVHAYFIRGGTWEEPIRFEVDRIRNGRSFTTRRVVARQSNGAILNLACSFQRAEAEADVQTIAAPTDLPGPADLGAEAIEDWGFMERRRIPLAMAGDRLCAWLRVVPPLGDDPFVDAIALAYSSDDLPTEAAAQAHPQFPRDHMWNGVISASLDHALWFHRHAPADEWQLHVLEGRGLNRARGLTFGEVFTESGLHVASFAQEILFRVVETQTDDQPSRPSPT